MIQLQKFLGYSKINQKFGVKIKILKVLHARFENSFWSHLLHSFFISSARMIPVAYLHWGPLNFCDAYKNSI